MALLNQATQDVEVRLESLERRLADAEAWIARTRGGLASFKGDVDYYRQLDAEDRATEKLNRV